MKVKIHPSPAATAASGGDAALRLLPAAVFALCAALGAEDREVLAYLILRSAAAAAAGGGGGGGRHRSAFDCGCFDCYTGFWWRWDRSPNRELISQVIEAFEESLAAKERSSGKGKRKGNKSRKGNMPMPVTVPDATIAPSAPSAPSATVREMIQIDVVSETVIGEEGDGDGNAEEEEKEEEEMVAAVGERRGRWPDVLGLIQSRILSFWGPGI